MSIRLDGDAATEWRTHWPIVLASTFGVTASTLNVYSAGLFIGPLQDAFGWSRAEIASGSLIVSLVTLFAAPFIGSAIDRIGARRIGLFGVAGLCILTAMLSVVGPGIWSWWAVWAFLAAINVFLQPMVWTSAVAGYFSRGRGLAFAVALCGSGLGSLTIPILTYEMIAHLGWRLAFVGLGVVCGVVVLPILLLCFTSRKDRERSGRSKAVRPARRPWPAARLALRSRPFLQLATAALLIATVTVSFAVNVVPILVWNGLARGQAASIASMLGLASITGRLAIGWLLDRVDGRILAGVSVSLPVIASAILISMPGAFVPALAATLVLGLALGTELDLVAYMASRHFGLESFGLLFGTICGVITLAGGLGPWLISLLYDQSHSYLLALWVAIPMCLGAAILFLLLGPYPTSVHNAEPIMVSDD